MWDVSNISTVMERLKPLPWRATVVVATVSFLLASAVSTLLGWMLMGHTASVNAGGPVISAPDVHFSNGPTLSKASIDDILRRNIFNAAGEAPTDDSQNPTKGEEISKTQLAVKVTGIIYGGDPTSGLAMVENTQKHSVNSFLAGDQLTPEAIVKEILQDRIIIENQGRKEYALLEEEEIVRSTRKGKKTPAKEMPTTLGGSGYTTEPPPETYKEEGFERKGTTVEMSSEFKNRLLTADFASVLQDAKASPNVVNGVLKGWRLDRIRKGSIYEKAGIQNGDVITELNGVQLNDAAQSIKILQGLRNESEIDMGVLRGDARLNFNLKVR